MTDRIAPVLAKLVARTDLDAAEVESAFGAILAGEASDVQAAGFIVALRTKGETVEELSALVATMRRYGVAVEAPAGAIDCVGSGGDRAGTVNVSTMAAVVAAGAGATVVKHGNRAASSHCGSADVLEALGVPIELGAQGVERCVREARIGFCFAPRFHPAMRFLGPARRELGVPTSFNFLGPLVNPASVTRQVVGVSDPDMAERMLGVLQANGSQHAWVFHGDDGLDELTTTTTSTVRELRAGEVRCFTLDPREFGLARVGIEALRGGDAAHNAQVMRSTLSGGSASSGAVRDVVVLNAAAALVVAGIASDLADGLARAASAIDDGHAAATLDQWIAVGRAAAAAEAE